MEKIETAPLGEPSDVLQSQLWASHIILSPLDMTVPTEQQIADYEGYAARRADEGVTAAKLSITQENYSQWGFSFNLNAETGVAVMRHSVTVAVEGLDSAGVDVSELEFIGAHVATIKALKGASEARRDIDPCMNSARIVEDLYKATDSQRYQARKTFYDVRSRAQLLNSELADLAPTKLAHAS